MLKLNADGWVLVADGKKALFLRNDQGPSDYDLTVVHVREQDNPPTHEQGVDRPGRAANRPSGHGAAMKETDWHQLAEDDFAKHLADMLYDLSLQGAFEQIVLVAPPAVQAEMRKVLHPEVKAKLLAEIPKTLTNHPVTEIAQLVKAELDALSI